MDFLISIVSKSKLFDALFRRRSASIFSRLIINPEYLPNDLITSRRVMCDCLSQTNDVMPLANVTNFNPLHSNVMTDRN